MCSAVMFTVCALCRQLSGHSALMSTDRPWPHAAKYCRFQPSLILIADCSVIVIMQSADHSSSHSRLSQLSVLCSDVNVNVCCYRQLHGHSALRKRFPAGPLPHAARYSCFQPSLLLIADCSVNVSMPPAVHSGSHLWMSKFALLCSDVHCLCSVS